MESKIKAERFSLAAGKLCKALRDRGYDADYFETAEAAVDAAISAIPAGGSVSFGGSLTLERIGILNRVKGGNFTLLDRAAAKDEDERREIMKKSLSCDVYLSSVNAISEDGVMVNIDGNGNRIAAIAYGPEKVFLFIGRNKLCRSESDALTRARTVAAPENAIRLGVPAPCAADGVCRDCQSPCSICSQIVIMRRNRIKNRIRVFLINDDLGL